MKQYRNLCGVTAVLLLAASLFAAPAVAEESGLITKASKYGAKETIQRFEEAIKSKGWVVFSEIDHAGAAKQFGIEMKARTVVLFGNPRIDSTDAEGRDARHR